MTGSMRLLARTLPLAWLALVGARGAGPVVTIDQTRSAIFGIAGVRSASCITAARLHAAGPQRPQPIWSVERLDRAVCIRQLTYGATPAGFMASAGGEPLAPGKAYEVTLLGSGFDESRTFVAR